MGNCSVEMDLKGEVNLKAEKEQLVVMFGRHYL